MHEWNQTNPNFLIGLDSQISNWAIGTKKELVYLDISTPLYRKDHKEALKAEMFLRSTPFFLRVLIKKLFLQEVLDRYYDFREILLDAIANLYKEKLENQISLLLEYTNHFLKEECKEYPIKGINIQEIQKYYKRDAFIWKLYLSSRKLDRWITTKIFKNRYEFLLPEKIER